MLFFLIVVVLVIDSLVIVGCCCCCRCYRSRFRKAQVISRNLLPGRLFEAIRVTNFMKSLGPSGLVVVDDVVVVVVVDGGDHARPIVYSCVGVVAFTEAKSEMIALKA